MMLSTFQESTRRTAKTKANKDNIKSTSLFPTSPIKMVREMMNSYQKEISRLKEENENLKSMLFQHQKAA